jgi:hypothetical protein
MSQPSEPHREGDASDAMLDELLRAAAAEPEPLPPGLFDDVERFIAARCRRRRRALAGMAAAAMVLALAACWLATRMPRQAPQGVAVHDVPEDRHAPALVQPASQGVQRVTVDAGRGLIAVPIRTGQPNFTIVWLYQAVEHPPREPR